MAGIRYLTAGESHGKALTAIIDGLPAGIRISQDEINRELKERQKGYGRGKRMQIESDRIQILSGVRAGQTLGSPITLLIDNKDWPNWQQAMDPFDASAEEKRTVTRPRPGHADLAGMMKYGISDARNILERASARETAIRVAVGAVAKSLLKEFGIEIIAHVIEIGGVKAEVKDMSWKEVKQKASESTVRCAEEKAEKEMIKAIDEAITEGDTLGGTFEIIAINVPPGLGSHVQWDRKLDGLLAQAIMSIQAVKAVEIGMGKETALTPGSKVHDEIFYEPMKGFFRSSNNAGGIEGGISNGEPVVIRGTMKPIPTLGKPLKSVDVHTKEQIEAAIERSDACAVPACAHIGKSVTAIVIANEMLKKFGADGLEEMRYNYGKYKESIKAI